MRAMIVTLLAWDLLLSSGVAGEEPLNVAQQQRRILADYQRVVASTQDPSARAAAARLAREACQRLVSAANSVDKLGAEDLHALGHCHEWLGETDKAKQLYAKSLAASPQAQTHLALARVLMRDDLPAAEGHVSKAAELLPEHPDLPAVRVALAAAHAKQRNWAAATRYLENLLAYTRTLTDRTPGSTGAQLSHAAVQRQLDRVRRFAGMTGRAAPPLKAQQWAQGPAAELDALKGKVVLVDFCAMWAAPSRARMEQLKQLHKKYAAKGLEIVGVTLAYQHKYDEAADQVIYAKDFKPEDARAALAAFAKKHEIPWRLGVIDQKTTDEYGVSTLPHTVAIGKTGNVEAILLSSDQAAEELDAIVKGLLQ